MGNVAADRNRQSLETLQMAANSEGIEQGLGRVFVLAIAGIDHRARHLLSQQFDSA